MKNITDEIGRKTLKKLQDLINSNSIRPTEAWSCFSSPKSIHKLKIHTVNFTEDEIKSLNGLREEVKKIIKQKSAKDALIAKEQWVSMDCHGILNTYVANQSTPN